MYLAIDVGASKTLVAVFDKNGRVVRAQKIKTAKDYDAFIKDLETVLSYGDFKQNYHAACCAIPGKVDRDKGVGITFGNLPWKNVTIKTDLEKLLGGMAVYIENDAKLAGLYEAAEYKDRYKNILYLTISTGIGAGVYVDGKLDPASVDNEAGHIVLMHEGHLRMWEDFASGRALKKKYGKLASEIDDPEIWQSYAKDLAPGIDAVISVIQPNAIIIGGGVGAHLEKFQPYLEEELKKYENNLVKIPPIIKAKRPEEAVIYGCYEYIKQSN